mmetsp:Transcript_23888/g.47733  ORF Transcript_23888/g.47733 Transcript_23888/m.47733 type:complete len:129 (-) Transcript_23888:723-1109(-)
MTAAIYPTLSPAMQHSSPATFAISAASYCACCFIPTSCARRIRILRHSPTPTSHTAKEHCMAPPTQLTSPRHCRAFFYVCYTQLPPGVPLFKRCLRQSGCRSHILDYHDLSAAAGTSPQEKKARIKAS